MLIAMMSETFSRNSHTSFKNSASAFAKLLLNAKQRRQVVPLNVLALPWVFYNVGFSWMWDSCRPKQERRSSTRKLLHDVRPDPCVLSKFHGIGMDIMESTDKEYASGLKWIEVRSKELVDAAKELQEFSNVKLANALATKRRGEEAGKDVITFTQSEWEEFGLNDNSPSPERTLKWEDVGTRKPRTGSKLQDPEDSSKPDGCKKLAEALLTTKNEFTHEEWVREFGIRDLRNSHYIRSDDAYYKPVWFKKYQFIRSGGKSWKPVEKATPSLDNKSHFERSIVRYCSIADDEEPLGVDDIRDVLNTDLREMIRDELGLLQDAPNAPTSKPTSFPTSKPWTPQAPSNDPMQASLRNLTPKKPSMQPSMQQTPSMQQATAEARLKIMAAMDSLSTLAAMLDEPRAEIAMGAASQAYVVASKPAMKANAAAAARDAMCGVVIPARDVMCGTASTAKGAVMPKVDGLADISMSQLMADQTALASRRMDGASHSQRVFLARSARICRCASATERASTREDVAACATGRVSSQSVTTSARLRAPRLARMAADAAGAQQRPHKAP